jgi:hypothetical protein
MIKRIHTLLLMSSIAVMALSAAATAQTNSLTNFPESDALAHVNVKRIVNEALPRLLPEAEYAKLKQELDKIKQFGFDIAQFETAALGLRLKGLATGGGLEMLLVVRGSFNADALVSLGRMALQGKYREEKHGSKTVTILKGADLAGPGGKNPLPMGVAELAVTVLDSGTLALGTTAYAKDAIDAQAGTKRINPEIVSLVTRDTSLLVSAAGVFPKGALLGFMPAEVKSNEEISRILAGIDQILINVGMDAKVFPLTGLIRTANEEDARTVSGLLEFAVRAGAASIKDASLKSLVDSLKITTAGPEVQLRATLAQETVASLLHNLFKANVDVATPKPKTEQTEEKKPASESNQNKKP